jgi:outer membrane lipoprotein-sorting protein
MRKLLFMTLALLFVFGVAGAGSDHQISGKIQKIETADRMVVLEDGTQLWLAEGVSVYDLKEGSSVKCAYEHRDGKKVVTSVEVSE